MGKESRAEGGIPGVASHSSEGVRSDMRDSYQCTSVGRELQDPIIAVYLANLQSQNSVEKHGILYTMASLCLKYWGTSKGKKECDIK